MSRAKKVELTSNNEEQATKKKGRGALQRERKRKAKESGSESIVEKKLRKPEKLKKIDPKVKTVSECTKSVKPPKKHKKIDKEEGELKWFIIINSSVGMTNCLPSLTVLLRYC